MCITVCVHMVCLCTCMLTVVCVYIHCKAVHSHMCVCVLYVCLHMGLVQAQKVFNSSVCGCVFIQTDVVW